MKENVPWHKRLAPRLQAPHEQITEQQPTPDFNPILPVPLLDEAWDDVPEEIEKLLGVLGEKG